MKKLPIPLAAMEKIIREAGAERVSEEAKQILNELLFNYSESIARKSIMFAEHAMRETIKAKDIKLAIKKF